MSSGARLLLRLAVLAAAAAPLAAAALEPGWGDPTRPPGRGGGAAGIDAEELPEVAMVRLERARRRALIEGRWYRLGAEVEGLRLRRIGASSVDLVADETTYTVPVIGHGVEMRRRSPAQPQGKVPWGKLP
ncbi:hypothetical protein [Halorhodospira neutriphila]|uniref:MSHA biogenesis protein MshK n=1 Tax=Halorhodospira neutriphila TaxID=168379 RepID=A0ABS1E824_9GAMM|nr:hypothetical protein [Halorhodospira neutriphila]MBK1727339.1 hypothetical protein [Halorhodospira neutriphila]